MLRDLTRKTTWIVGAVLALIFLFVIAEGFHTLWFLIKVGLLVAALYFVGRAIIRWRASKKG